MNDVTGMPQRIVVLGGGSDLAQSLVRRLATRRLSAVVLAVRDERATARFADELERLGVKQVETMHFDVRATDEHERFAADCAARLGEIDLVVVAAGLLGTAELDGLDPTAVAELLETNFSGPAAAMMAFAKVLRAQGHGGFLVYSSAAAMRVRAANFVYGAAKTGLDGFAVTLGDLLEPSGVGMLVVRPGFVSTKMTAGHRPPPLRADIELVTDAIVRGLEEGATALWIPKALGALARVAPFIPRRIWRSLPG